MLGIKNILGQKVWLLSGAGLVVVASVLFLTLGGNGVSETITPSAEDLVKTVKISGKVIPQEKIDLSFEISGTVSSVGKKVGENVYPGEALVRLNAGGVSAEVAEAQAELTSAQAELSKLNGTESYQNSIDNAKRSLVQTMRDAYTAASDAVTNKSDQTFIDPRSNRPEIAGLFTGYNQLRDSLSKRRIALGYLTSDWQKFVAELSVSSYSDSSLNLTKDNLETVTSFISDVSVLVNIFEATDSMPQTTIDKYKTDILAARNNLNSVSQDLISSEDSLTKLLGDVPVQLARVEAAKASLANLQFKLNNTVLTSPIQGVISRQDAKVGQGVTANTSLVSIISPNYEIETFVPELLIAGIEVGNSAKVTLDTYGSDQIFEAKVKLVDPAETIKDGVSTYKVTLAFLTHDARIKSGMTANVEIETFRKAGSIIIPARAVVTEGEKSFVWIIDSSNKERKVEVNIGEKDSQGNVEILSGISSADKVVINPLSK